MRRLPILLLIATAAAMAAADQPEGWRPAEHPAQVQRPVAGLTRPKRMLAVAAEVAGRVAEPGPEMGAAVPPGAQLVLDDSLARADRAVAQAAADQAAAEAAHRDREARRVERLFADARISEGERDAAVHAARAAGLALTAAQAQLARADAVLARHRVALPAGWRVLRRLREAGAVVQAGEAVLELGDLATVTVVLHLDEAEIAALPAAVASVAGVPVAVAAWRVAESADPASRKRQVEVDLPGAVGGGREALVILRLPDPSGALVVPAAFVRAELDGRLVRTRDGRRLRVTVLHADPDGLAILPTPELVAAELVRP